MELEAQVRGVVKTKRCGSGVGVESQGRPGARVETFAQEPSWESKFGVRGAAEAMDDCSQVKGGFGVRQGKKTKSARLE